VKRSFSRLPLEATQLGTLIWPSASTTPATGFSSRANTSRQARHELALPVHGPNDVRRSYAVPGDGPDELVDTWSCLETASVHRRPDHLAELCKGALIGPHVDDGESGLAPVADVVESLRLLDDRLPANLEHLVVLGDVLSWKLEDCDDWHVILLEAR